jgi:hypothetical protein
MFAASMEAPSYGASKLPFAIRHRPTVYATKFASCVGYPLRYSGSSFLSARWLRLRSFRYSAIAPKISFDILYCEVITFLDTDLLAYVPSLLRLACKAETITACDGDRSPKWNNQIDAAFMTLPIRYAERN